MKLTSKLTLAGIGAMLTAATVQAQSAKFGAVDVRKIYEEYYKTKIAQRNFDESVAAYRKDQQQRVADYNKLNEEFQKLREEANNPALTADKREQKTRQSQEKLAELRRSVEALKEFEQNGQQFLNDQRRRQNEAILKDILEVIRKKSAEGAYTLVFDKSGFGSVINMPATLYADDKLDLTDIVLKELNANAPANLPATSTPAAPLSTAPVAPAPGGSTRPLPPPPPTQ
ncbi:MAG: OmpH family outer membrane protein [Verrucomicrobiae bacterium]|nr:OmpH family outer membrane protein [Verrucomicrobiae bacterium]